MDFYLISVLVFIAILAVLVYIDRKQYKRESILLLRRTQRGRKLIISIGTRFPRFWKYLGYVSVGSGFIVSVIGVKMLLDNFIRAVTVKSAAPSLALLLPSPTSQPVFGYGFLAVPFWYWIICIALLAMVHEGLHGIYSAFERVKIKSLGFGILAVIPLAFVEPDEKQLKKKGTWPMLRVFSAGSFANFLLALLTFLIIVSLSASIYHSTGISFAGYSAAQIPLSSIEKIQGVEVSGSEPIKNTLSLFGENDTLEISTGNATFLMRDSLLLSQLDQNKGTVIVYEDYPAARAGLSGTIERVGDRRIKDSLDLSRALEEAGANATIRVVTREGEEEKVYLLTTAERPEDPPYKPDGWVDTFVIVEHVIPGSLELSYGGLEALANALGQRTGVTWVYAQSRMEMWDWIAKNYPLIKQRAEERSAYWKGQMDARNKPGFIGIMGPATALELLPGLEPYADSFIFIEGLLGFLFVINIGVAIVNLLPAKPLDGGRMYEAVLLRYLPEKRVNLVMRGLGYFVLALLVLNFIPFGAIF